MLKQELNFSLRISVINNCNFRCQYCPRNTSMENFCPTDIQKNILPSDEFLTTITSLVSKYKFSKVVVTGGEPLLAQDLPLIMDVIKKNGQFLELDTNGSLFSEKKWQAIKRFPDGVKISLDSLDAKTFSNITNCPDNKCLENIQKLIRACIKDNIPVTLNVVATKLNINDIQDIIQFAKSNKINISLLDLYYTKETHNFWLQNYVDLDKWVAQNKQLFEKIEVLDDFGCHFIKMYYNMGRNYVRIKSSASKTMRDNLCDKCPEYCQEGVFALRLSRQGWVTSCQRNGEIGGYYTQTDKIEEMITRINNTKSSTDSFAKLLTFYNLTSLSK